jgi:hypothetical protein
MRPFGLFIVANLAALALSNELNGAIVFLGPGAVVPPTKLSLNGGEYETLTRVDGFFTFHNVKPGIHLLDVLSPVGMFSQVKLNIPADPTKSIRCLEYRYPGAPKQEIECSPLLKMTPLGRIHYFEERPQVSFLGMLLGNPMILIMGSMALLVTCLPKMMGEDFQKEFQEQQAKMQEDMGGATDPMSMLSKLMSGGVDSPAPKISPASASPAINAAAKRPKRQTADE